MRRRVTARLVAGSAALGLAARAAVRRLRAQGVRGKAALVTGGSRGLGFALARELALGGARVAICARGPASLERARARLAAEGLDVLATPCDVSDTDRVQRWVEEVADTLGGIDVLVNNAGVIAVGPQRALTREDFEEAMAIHFWGTLDPILAALPHLRARGGGTVVNVTSIGGKVSVPHLLAYTPSKFAAVGLSEGLRGELAPEGIHVLTVVPGLMRTGSALNAFFKGPGERMFGLFSPMASWPIISMDAERAARRIVQAVKRGESEIILGLPANLAARFHGLFPGLTADLAGLANHLLPRADGPETSAERGMELYRRLSNPILDRAIGWTLSAARRFNQHPGPLDAPGLGRHASRSERA